MKEMPNRIRELREKAGLSLQKLAEMIIKLDGEPTSAQQIDRLEKGQRRLTQDWMNSISEALGCMPFELLPEHRPPKPEKGALTQPKTKALKAAEHLQHEDIQIRLLEELDAMRRRGEITPEQLRKERRRL